MNPKHFLPDRRCSDEKVKKNKNARPPRKRNGIIVCTKYYVLENRERERGEERKNTHKDVRRLLFIY